MVPVTVILCIRNVLVWRRGIVLMCVDNCSQVDLASADLLFQNGRYSSVNVLASAISYFKPQVSILVGMGWIDNHGIFCFVVDN
jgi:hypothetical protein